MKEKFCNDLKKWKKGEIIFYSIIMLFTLLLTIIPAVIFNLKVIYVIFAIFAVLVFILVMKKTLLGYFLGIVLLTCYSFIAFREKYYSEIILCGLFLLPYLITEIISWFKPNRIVKNDKLRKNQIIELVIVLIITGALLYGGLKLFTAMQNNWPLVSICCVSLIGLMFYFTTYKSKLWSSIMFFGYTGCALAQWVLSSAFSALSYIPVGIFFIIIFVISLRRL